MLTPIAALINDDLHISDMVAWRKRSSEGFLHAGTVRLAAVSACNWTRVTTISAKQDPSEGLEWRSPRCQIRKVVEMELDYTEYVHAPTGLLLAFPVPCFVKLAACLKM
jgi:hypothetical protein